MATQREKWENIRLLGEGGQGKVYLVRRPERIQERSKAMFRIQELLRNGYNLKDSISEELTEKLFICGRTEEAHEAAALKEFKVEDRDQELAIGRLEAEIKALKTIRHPAVLKLEDSSVEERFLVTEYLPGGSLMKRPNLFKGDAFRAVKALKALAEGVRHIHEQGAIHRDIKPENIFVADSGSLVLGDFGIVIFMNDDRWTGTFERAGTRYWMAPWVDRKRRITVENIDATLDIYPLGKLLWSMISGEDMLPREDFEDQEYNLEAMFLDSPREMRKVNAFLKKCVVAKRDQCLPDVAAVINELAALEIVLGGKREGNIQKWPCRVCRMGEYEPQHTRAAHDRASVPIIVQSFPRGYSTDSQYHMHVHACNHCGNVELFMGSAGR